MDGEGGGALSSVNVITKRNVNKTKSSIVFESFYKQTGGTMMNLGNDGKSSYRRSLY